MGIYKKKREPVRFILSKGSGLPALRIKETAHALDDIC